MVWRRRPDRARPDADLMQIGVRVAEADRVLVLAVRIGDRAEGR